jgi:hypothetical protein
VQVAHRIETLKGSDVLYFVEHGRVVEVGGEKSMNGTAIDELVARDIEYEEVTNPETGKKEEHIVRGFYRQLHEAYYDLDFHKMGLPQLIKKVRSLEEQLKSAKLEKEAKLAPLLNKLPMPLNLDRAQSAAAPCVSKAQELSLTTNTDSIDDEALNEETPLISGPPKLSMLRCKTEM